MTATENLRRMLDERGVEWIGTNFAEPTEGHPTNTSLGSEHHDAVFIEGTDGSVLRLFDLTPEQAIAATLGAGTCYNASYRLDESRFHCSECGFGCWVKDVADGRDKLPKHCPNCGRRVINK